MLTVVIRYLLWRLSHSSYISWILLAKTEFKTCSLLHKIILNKWSAASTSSEQKPQRIPHRWMTASSRWWSSAAVKRRRPLAAWLRTDRSEAVGCEWRYVLLVVKARNDNDDDCIWSTLGKLSRMLSRIREIFIETLNKNFTEFFNVKKFVKFYIAPSWQNFRKQ